MGRYTTIRISLDDKKRLERLAKLMGNRSLVDTLRCILDIAERELDRYKGDLKAVFSSLRYAKDVGETDAEDVDRYLYGGDE
ncbi:MAG: hypothetical protein DRZ82_09200 [Thermoprotei archaeon]|nr:MAG: hypothetical protein DRZ82_09200 [Thermoprotei archaeon]